MIISEEEEKWITKRKTLEAQERTKKTTLLIKHPVPHSFSHWVFCGFRVPLSNLS
jgi:hypothetical protein